MSIFNIAIIGAGIGAAHIRGYQALTDQFKVATVCDLDTDRAREAADGLTDCAIVDDIATVLADPAIDMVNICLPPHLHFPIMMDALAAGKHVICEKPFTTSLAEADKVVARAKETDRQVFPVFQYRYGLGYQQMMQLIRQGLAGKAFVASLETHWQRGGDYYAVPWRGSWASERGGAIVGHAIHIHNLITHALGSVVKVGAFLETKVNPIETEDCGSISMKMASGALVTSSITLGAAGDSSRMRLCFANVTVQSDLLPYAIGEGDWTFTATDPARQGEIDAAIATVSQIDLGFAGMFAQIHDVLSEVPGAGSTNIEDARHSIELISAIYQASRNDEIVSLPLSVDSPLYNGWVPEGTDV